MNEQQATIRLTQASLEDKLSISRSLCAWCYKVGKTNDGKLVYFTPEQQKQLIYRREMLGEEQLTKAEYNHGICPICYDKVEKQLGKHIDYIIKT